MRSIAELELQAGLHGMRQPMGTLCKQEGTLADGQL